MKRLFFNQKDKNKLYTNEILCLKDVFKGEIILTDKDITWYLYTSGCEVSAQGKSSSVNYAQKAIKKELIKRGAAFDREHRKYKI